MIISRGRNYIFVHAPKTGGTSMALALEARAMRDDLMLGDTPKALRRRRRLRTATSAGRLWKHSTLADIDGLITRDALADFFIFTMVRNPWDRVVSYYHWLRTQRFDHPAVMLAQAADFRGFVADPGLQASLAASPAGHYVTDAGGRERCDAFIRLEHLAEDLAPVDAHLGFALRLPHANPSDRTRDWRAFYDTHSAEAVARACAADIARFGYGFDDDLG